MARILLGSYMVRYPLGGMLSWALQYLLGFHRLGHEVYLVEMANYPSACFDPSVVKMSDDCTFGVCAVNTLLSRFGLGHRWCFVDYHGEYYGLTRHRVKELFDSADLFVDAGTHGAWLDEVAGNCPCVLIDGEPGFTQMKWEQRLAEQMPISQYHHYYTNGCLVGTPNCQVPLAAQSWKVLFNPVIPELFGLDKAPADAPYTTVMNWQSHQDLEYAGRRYGQKDVEFRRFVELPKHVAAPMEVAVAGSFPRVELLANNWRVRDGHQVTRSFDAYRNYIQYSRGEFSVCKNVFVATSSGWFSDRSAAYLAAGRPVVLQDTGFSQLLPTGEGLFAPRTVEEAAEAIFAIDSDYDRHSRAAREIAMQYLSTDTQLESLVNEVLR